MAIFHRIRFQTHDSYTTYRYPINIHTYMVYSINTINTILSTLWDSYILDTLVFLYYASTTLLGINVHIGKKNN